MPLFPIIQSLFLVSMNLALNIKNGMKINPRNLSVDQFLRMHNQIATILNNDILREAEKKIFIDEIESKFLNSAFINIVEEPEQNLFPTSQKEILYCLLEFNNLSAANKLIITTHSPYLINYLTLAVKAEMVKASINSEDAKSKLNKIVPLLSTVKADDLVIYELDEINGTIKKLEDYKGLPSDDNDLNSELENSNELFAQLQEIEKGWR